MAHEKEIALEDNSSKKENINNNNINNNNTTNNNNNMKNKVLAQEINKNMLILNYIYDNSLEQLQKMDLKTYDLNYLEEFKHIPLDNRITPLILGCYLGRQEIVKLLLQNPTINIDKESDDNGFTPLSVSCMSGFYELTEYLIRKGADVNKKNQFGQTPFYHCFTRLEEQNNYFENKRLCLKLADLLLDHGANIDEIVNNKKGYTMLMVFCSVKIKMNLREMEVNKACIRYMIENGANINKLTKKGKTIYDLLSKHQNQEVIAAMIKNTSVKRLKSDPDLIEKRNSTEQQQALAQSQSQPQSNNKKPFSRINLGEDDNYFKMEGITRESNTCCSIFSFF